MHMCIRCIGEGGPWIWGSRAAAPLVPPSRSALIIPYYSARAGIKHGNFLCGACDQK
uniref:Uncharacterized protein n=1 Tax=Arundo donax TaxID=35708 RepID=A0A0A8ZQ94_ARUDO